MGQIGNLVLYLSLAAAVVTVFASLFSSRKKGPSVWDGGSIGVAITLGLLSVAILILEAALLTHDFSLEYVWGHTSLALSVPYLLTALWAGNAGFLLLWAWLLSACGLILLLRWKDTGTELRPTTTAVIMGAVTFFLVLLLFVDSPFKAIPTPQDDGIGMRVALQTPAMVVHPPVLLGGYVLFTIPFALAIAALAQKRLDEAWLIKARAWTVGAWLLLGLGNLIGAWWAYADLAFGGYWAWDPVENSSLMPWLVGTALLHSLHVQRRRKSFKITTMALGILTFFMVIFGAFLTRTDLGGQRHGFGNVGVPYFSLMLLTIFFGGFGLLYSRLNHLKSENEIESVVSKDAAFFLNNVLLVGSMVAVLFGTLAPLFIKASDGARGEVSKSFYNLSSAPIFLIIVLLAGVCVMLGWRKAVPKGSGRGLLVAAIGGVLVLAGLLVAGVTAVGAVGYGIAAFLLVATIYQCVKELRARGQAGQDTPRRSLLGFLGLNKNRYGAYLVHFSLALMTVGIIGSSFFDESVVDSLTPGESVNIKGYTLTYRSSEIGQTEDKMFVASTSDVYRNGVLLDTVVTRRLIHSEDDQSVKVAIRSTLAEDLYIIPGIQLSDLFQGWDPAVDPMPFEVFVNPLLVWIWIGGGFFLLGGVICWWPRAEKVAVPAKTVPSRDTGAEPPKRSVPAQPQAQGPRPVSSVPAAGPKHKSRSARRRSRR